MDKGSYRGRRVDFTRYAVSVFNPHLFCGSNSSLMGCGACALALLTGIAPETIAAKNGGVHYPDDFMMRFLRQQRFNVLPLTLCNLSMAKSDIGPEHVVLLSQLFTKNEATWGVIFHGIYYHNFRIYSLDTLSMLNKPVLSAYVILDPKWRIHPLGGQKPAPKPALKNSRLTLASPGRIMRSASSVPQPRIKK